MDSPTTSQSAAPTSPDPLDRLVFHFYLSFPLIHDAIRVRFQVMIFYFDLSLIFRLILSRGLYFYYIYRLRTPFTSIL